MMDIHSKGLLTMLSLNKPIWKNLIIKSLHLQNLKKGENLNEKKTLV